MSIEKQINNSILEPFLSPSINFASLKARLRFNEFKKKFSKDKYNNFFRKCNNLNEITSKMNNKYSMSDLYDYEKENSLKLKNELKNINNNLKKYQQKKLKKNNFKYRLKLSNDSQSTEKSNNINNLIESVKEDISKYLYNLHYSNNEKKDKRIIFNNLKINIHPLLRNNLRTKSVSLKSFNYFKSLSNRSTEKSFNFNPNDNQGRRIPNFLNKSRIKKFISIDQLNNIKSKLSLFSNIENKQNRNNKEKFVNFNKFPFVRQNSYSFISLSKQGENNYNFDTNKYDNPNLSNESSLINLPNI